MKLGWIGFLTVSVAAVLLSFFLVQSVPADHPEPATLTDYLPTPRPNEVCDVCEPNSSLIEACGPLSPATSYQFPVRCTTGRDDDWYYIDLECSGTVCLDVTNIPAGTDYSVYLYNEARVILCSSDQHGNTPEHVCCPLDQAGRYYVRVYPWEGCSDDDPYTLTVSYPIPAPRPTPTPMPTPPCNVHIDDFGDTNPRNDLRQPSGWKLDPPECGTFDVTYTGSDLQLGYDLTGPISCTARYTTGLSLDASLYSVLAWELKGDDREQVGKVVVGLRDKQGHEKRIRVGDLANQVIPGDWQRVGLPLAIASTALDVSQLDTMFIELTDANGAGQGDIYLDRLRLEQPLVPLIVDNFDDLADPNALGGGSRTNKGRGSTIDTGYVTDGTYDHSSGSLAITYTIPSTGERWALWETDLQGLNVSEYNDLFFYIRGAKGDERVNVYLWDGRAWKDYVNVEDYARVSQEWTAVRIPLRAFSGVALDDLTKLQFVFEWEPMSGTVLIDNVRFIAETLLVDSFCDADENNSLNGRAGCFTSMPSCAATITSTFSGGVHRLDYDVTAGPDCYAGHWSKTSLDLNPYCSLVAKVRGERCGQVAGLSADTRSAHPEKIKLSDYLPDGITDQWQEVRIPLAAYAFVPDWTQGDVYAVAFERHRGASSGSIWWDDAAFETGCAALWVDNFNDEDDTNALNGGSGVFKAGLATMSSSLSILHGNGDAGAGLVLSYTVHANEYAGWETGLRNVDLAYYDWLVFDIKMLTGYAKLNVYLIDGADRCRFVNLEDYIESSNKWQPAAIPLEAFGGVDRTQIKALRFVVEWESGTVRGSLALDNIHFIAQSVFLPLVMNRAGPTLLGPGEYRETVYPALVSADPALGSSSSYHWDFETGTEGWKHQTYVDSQAVIAVTNAGHRSYSKSASLAMIVDLVGGDTHKGQGEAFVDLATDPPLRVTAPVDLECKPLRCWIYVPTCGLGDPAAPNEVQLFVKDAYGRSEYGTSIPVLRNQWFEIELRPSTVAPAGGYMDKHFNPRAIQMLGVRYRAGSEQARYRGKVYLDACGWQEIDPPSTTDAGACVPAWDR